MFSQLFLCNIKQIPTSKLEILHMDIFSTYQYMYVHATGSRYLQKKYSEKLDPVIFMYHGCNYLVASRIFIIIIIKLGFV